MTRVEVDCRELQVIGSPKLCSPLPLKRSRQRSSVRRTVRLANISQKAQRLGTAFFESERRTAFFHPQELANLAFAFDVTGDEDRLRSFLEAVVVPRLCVAPGSLRTSIRGFFA